MTRLDTLFISRTFDTVSRIVPTTIRGFAFVGFLIFALFARAAEENDSAKSSALDLLTNLYQLRQVAEQKSSAVVHPIRIVAETLDVDALAGVLAVRDSSGVEFLRLDSPIHGIEPGSMVRVESQGCGVKPKKFGLQLIPGMVVDNDGIHGMFVQSGAAFLHAGFNPIKVQWFNLTGGFGLNIEYQGPDLPRQRIPNSLLWRAKVDPATGVTNWLNELDYRCYEGRWGFLPDFTKLRPVKSGVATGFELGVRTRNEGVGLDFDGLIKIPRDGLYTFFVESDDGSRLCVGNPSLDVEVLSNNAEARVVAKAAETNMSPWVSLEGTVQFAGLTAAGGELVARVGNDDVRVEVLETSDSWPKFPLGSGVRVSGINRDVIAENGSRVPGVLLTASWKSIQLLTQAGKSAPKTVGDEEGPKRPHGETPTSGANLAIGTAADVKALSPELAKQGLPVSISGVVTAVLPTFIRGAAVQDSTKGIFVSYQDIGEFEPLKCGEAYQIDGVTGPGLFAPIVFARRITHLGLGQLPSPLHATWDQLINGSLDTQYAEIEGVATSIHNQQVTMLTEGGKITLETDFQSETLEGLENALLRIRGCFFSFFNEKTHELDARSLRVVGGAVEEVQPAPLDVFGAPAKSIGELLLYDPKAAPFRLLKVSGQVLYHRGGAYYLFDGTNGIRVSVRNSDRFAPGAVVDAVGFLELGGPAAERKEAVMRKTGQAPFPTPTELPPGRLLQAKYTGTLVQVDATLMNQWKEGSEQVLELQSGYLAFRALMCNRDQGISLPPAGSRLELIGVYAPTGSGSGEGDVSGFDLLLFSSASVRVLATPPWWTLGRVLALSGMLATLLLGVLIWNKELQRKVQVRSRQLETEIRNRQHAELQHAAEAERSRIARDLHDELGTGLTEVSLLAGTGVCDFPGMALNNDRFRAIAEKARSLVSGLDVIVWAIDPKRNSLQSFADYLGRYAFELFSATSIVCRFNIPMECEAVALNETARHSLFLAVKEALNNVIRHASATEVELQISQSVSRLQVIIADNGRGFDQDTVRRGNGLANLKARLEALNGQCDIESRVGKGTTISLTIPLPLNSSDLASSNKT